MPSDRDDVSFPAAKTTLVERELNVADPIAGRRIVRDANSHNVAADECLRNMKIGVASSASASGHNGCSATPERPAASLSVLQDQDRIRIGSQELPNLRVGEHRRPERLPPRDRAVTLGTVAPGDFLQNRLQLKTRATRANAAYASMQWCGGCWSPEISVRRKRSRRQSESQQRRSGASFAPARRREYHCRRCHDRSVAR